MKPAYSGIITAFCLVIIYSTGAAAQIYKWVDDQGKVHFGDAQKEKSSGAQKVIIKDKYTVPEAVQLTPIPHQGTQARTVVLNDITLELPESDERNVLIGRVVCKQPADLYWAKGLISIKRELLGPLFSTTLGAAGYNARVGDVAREEGELQLSGKIVKIFINSCTKNAARKLTQDSSYLKVDWTLYDPLQQKVVLELTTEGSHHGIKAKPVENGRGKSIDSAFEMAALNLLGHADFVDQLNQSVDIEQARASSEKIKLQLKYASGQTSFADNADDLKDKTVIVKTPDGHGSGVYIAEGGYILTNAHVVGNAQEFQIISDSGNTTATLLRKNGARDVALLKVADNAPTTTPVPISKSPVTNGEELYVIGTPLDIKFSQTITRGIVSAIRKIRGMDFIQTDAAINFGNSGGPVFNHRGELVAITVSSVMSRDGASMNINYLIPIDDALYRLDIDGGYSTLGLLDNIIPALDMNKAMKEDSLRGKVIRIIYDWLNKPVFRL